MEQKNMTHNKKKNKPIEKQAQMSCKKYSKKINIPYIQGQRKTEYIKQKYRRYKN